MCKYSPTISFWNNIFHNKVPQKIENIIMQNDIEAAIKFLTTDSKVILDYGCGSGTMLLRCAIHSNIEKCIGIDISNEAILLASKAAKYNHLEHKFSLKCDDLSYLSTLNENSIDGCILSNILDNVTINDCDKIMSYINKITKPNGKILIKLNPYLNDKKLNEYGLTLLNDNLYIEKEGIYLRNLDTSKWKSLIEKYFSIINFKEIYFHEFNQFNRLFLLFNKK
ncbi:class I SAM-dependent methyltransferase [Clostridium ihumii]|uniref:class I SAM-dependent methyltransferase n=1 Tax=Clostridium ihumii TaxID=1470356 RepID=UPI00059059F8|nr:class I SAM-dependent methyltransferase [Clostridium ihumii]